MLTQALRLVGLESAANALEGRDPKWPALRARHLRLHPACAACDTRDNLDVHHVFPYHLFPNLELSTENLITFCRRCHLFVGHLGTWESWNKNAITDAAIWLRKIKERPKG